MIRHVVCELARVEELMSELARAGVTTDSKPILYGSPGLEAAEWIGMEPSPSGGTFDLRAPIEGAGREPMWVEYFFRGESSGWNYTRDLVAFRIEV